MKNVYPLVVLACFACASLFAAKKDVKEEEIDPGVIQMAPFVVYEGLIDVIDGFSEEDYHGGHAVVEGFRETFNQLLLGYHRKLLLNEYEFMVSRLKVGRAFVDDLNALSGTFGIKPFEVNLPNSFVRERAVTRRLIRDPFFIIDALVVWDLDQLENYKDKKLYSKYAKDIRYNDELGKWERRITTKWEVNYVKANGRNFHYNAKFQGLNLDTNRGYHLTDGGLGPDVVSTGFKKVKLTYPIFINYTEPVEVQIQRLQQTYVRNLYEIYDPYSWIARRQARFRLGTKFRGQFREEVNRANFRMKDAGWFNSVLTAFLTDVTTIKHEGVREIYDLEMYTKLACKTNLLGVGVDLLNWNEGEDRSLPYDPTVIRKPNVKFNNANGARFILLDAYRRYGNRVVEVLREKTLRQLDRKAPMVSGKELVKSVLEEVSGAPANAYIKAAEKAQLAELNKFAYKLY